MPLHATARRLDDSLRSEISINGRHTIFTDEPATLGGTDSAPTPHELLPASLAACIATMMALKAERAGWDIGEVTVAVEYDNRSTPRHFDIDISVPADVTPEQLDRLRRVADACPVHRALEADFSFNQYITVEPEHAAA